MSAYIVELEPGLFVATWRDENRRIATTNDINCANTYEYNSCWHVISAFRKRLRRQLKEAKPVPVKVTIERVS